MPQSTLSLSRLIAASGGAVAPETLEALIFPSKAEIAGRDGDAITVEVTPDRLDLLSEGGLGASLAGAAGHAKGALPHRSHPPDASVSFTVDRSVSPLRPFLSAIRLEAPDNGALDVGLLAEAIRFQELLHATIGRNRARASLGLYPLERLVGPFRYTSEALNGVEFTPLDSTGKLWGDAFLKSHPMAEQYGALGARDGECLTLRDSRGTILSLPPILNSEEGGAIRVGDRSLLLESTGTVASRVAEAVGMLALPFVAAGWAVGPVPIGYPDRTDDGLSVLAPRPIPLPSHLLEEVSGRRFSASEVEHLLATCRLSGHPVEGGWTVDAPPWRPDLLSSHDVIEDVVLARGVQAEDGVVPRSATRGKYRPATRLRRRARELLLGCGYQPLVSPVLVAREVAERFGRATAIRVANPTSDELAVLRDSLLLSLYTALQANVRNGYPQKLAEVGPVVVRDPHAESGGSTRWRAAFVLASETAGFADAAALVDHLFRAFGAPGVREPLDAVGSISGRGARLRLAGESVAEMGELDPELLDLARVPVPVAWAEVDLTAAAPLLGSGQFV